MLFWLMGSTSPHSGGGRKSDVERKFRVTGSGNRKRQSPQLESLCKAKAYVPGKTVVAFTQAGESTSLKSLPRLGRSSSRDSDLGFEIFISLVGPESVLCTYFHRLHEGLLKEIQRALGFPQNLLN